MTRLPPAFFGSFTFTQGFFGIQPQAFAHPNVNPSTALMLRSVLVLYVFAFSARNVWISSRFMDAILRMPNTGRTYARSALVYWLNVVVLSVGPSAVFQRSVNSRKLISTFSVADEDRISASLFRAAFLVGSSENVPRR